MYVILFILTINLAGEDPPRPSLNGDSGRDPTCAGYMPARGDFAIEYDNYAELEVCDIDISPNEDELDAGWFLQIFYFLFN